MTDSYPTAIYFVQKKSEYTSFVGHLCKLAAFGYTLGLDVMFVTKDVTDEAPPELRVPGLWVKYSDAHWEKVGRPLS